MDNVFKTEVIYHRGENRLGLFFAFNSLIINQIKEIPGARWSQSRKCWHVPVETNLNDYLVLPENVIFDKNISENSKIKKAELQLSYEERIIYIISKYDKELINKLKAMNGIWQTDTKSWSIFYSKEHLKMLRSILTDMGYIITETEKSLNKENVNIFFKPKASRDSVSYKFIEQMKLENKSERTIEVYTSFVSQFLMNFNSFDIEHLELEKIRNYLLEERENKGYSASYQNQMVSALKYYYRSVYNPEFENNILPRPKKGLVLPKVISKEEVERIISLCTNEKHRMILYLLYGFGLRVSEVTNLRLCDIDMNMMNLYVINSKGHKDRVLPIPKVLRNKLQSYIVGFKPKNYFISGLNDKKYSSSSIQKIVKELALKASIKQIVTPHVLRHCYATHMLEKGTDLRYIQVLLGHKSSKTTEIYTHVSIKKMYDLANPMDDIKF